jgi:hypothetical protein
MIPINIDLTDVVKEFALSKEQSADLGKSIIDSIAYEYMYNWENLVNEKLKKTRKDYKRAMYMDRVSETEVVFGLSNNSDNPLPMMVEDGVSPFDMKTGFGESDKRKITENGWYLTIPFRHATSDAVAESTLFASTMPREVYNIAKGATAPLKISDLPEQYRVKGVRQEIRTEDKIWGEYKHKTAQYEGLVRVETSSGNEKKRGGYFTFRRVSNNSDPNSWIHPGFHALHLMDDAVNISRIPAVADQAIDSFLKSI